MVIILLFPLKCGEVKQDDPYDTVLGIVLFYHTIVKITVHQGTTITMFITSFMKQVLPHELQS